MPKYRTYLVYDRDTGRIVHRHRQDETVHRHRQGEEVGEPTRERILSLVRPEYDRDRLDILQVEEDTMRPTVRYRVNPSSRSLEELP